MITHFPAPFYGYYTGCRVDYPRILKHVDATHRLDGGLELAVEELQTVVEDVLVGGVQTGLDTVPHHVGSSGRTLQLQNLHRTRRHSGETF